jgi:hypothetical protein
VAIGPIERFAGPTSGSRDCVRGLLELGRERAGEFLERHLHKVGHKSSTDISAKFL